METMPLSELKVSNPYLRMGTDVEELEKSIRTVGLIAPLVISKDKKILAGGRRYQALLNLGFTEAPVMVVDKDELERELISIDENLVRKNLNKVELEGNLRRAKEIYQALNPEPETFEEPENSFGPETTSAAQEEDAPKTQVDKKEVLPAQKFLDMVSEKTGFSPRQIHQAIDRDEKASDEVKQARRNGELAISHTNEIIKLEKEHQARALEHLKNRPVREVKKFVKLAKTKGFDKAIEDTPAEPHAREFQEIEKLAKKLKKQFELLEMEGIGFLDLPEKTQKLMRELSASSDFIRPQAPAQESTTDNFATH